MWPSRSVEALARSALLRDLPAESLAGLGATARRRTYRRGEVIFHQGDPGDSIHVVESGRVKVVGASETGGEVVFSILGPGECFGELSLLDGQPRSATVEALEPVETVTLGRDDFLEVVRANPQALESLLTGGGAGKPPGARELADRPHLQGSPDQ